MVRDHADRGAHATATAHSTRADVDLAAELARRAAAAIETARLVRSLERSEERYRLLFEANPLPMWVYDAETLRFLAVNEAAVRHYGYTRSEFLAMTITDIRPRGGRRRRCSRTCAAAAARARRCRAPGATAARTAR